MPPHRAGGRAGAGRDSGAGVGVVTGASDWAGGVVIWGGGWFNDARLSLTLS